MSASADLNWIANYIWGIADDVLRDVYVRGKYRDVILPMTVLRRLDAVLESTKQAVLEERDALDAARVTNQEPLLRRAAGQAFYNTSKFTLKDLRARASPQQLKADFKDYLDGFSPNVQEILSKFEFRNQIPRLSKADCLGALIEKLTSPEINLSPAPVLDTNGLIRHPGLDNHGMGTVFEELIRRFNEENNEEAGEHFTPRDAVTLMAKLVFLPIADQIESTTYFIYDGACGTGGMLTVAENELQTIAKEHGKQVSTHLFGQEINSETYAICKADLLLKGEGAAADKIVGGPEHSTLSNDAFPERTFDFMLSNPPYGKSWKTDLQRMGGKKGMRDPRFLIEHEGDPEYSLVTRSSDGQMLFLANKLSKMKRGTKLGSRIAEVHNGSSLFSGTAGQGESNIRRWIIENDWLEAIVALPLNMFYNTGIATYIWVLTNQKPEHRRGKVQLIDATKWFQPLRKNLGKKTCELGQEEIERICRIFLDFEETEQSRILDNEAFGYWKVTVERPLRLRVDLSHERLDRFVQACRNDGSTDLLAAVLSVADQAGSGPHLDYSGFEFSVAQALHGRSNRSRLTARSKKLLRSELAEQDARSAPVIRRVCSKSTVAKPMWGVVAVGKGPRARVVEYECDLQLRDVEQIPLQETDGIEGFWHREIHPHTDDAWYDAKSVKVGYEINFNRLFHQPEPMRALREIRAEIALLEQSIEGLLEGIVGSSPALSKQKLRIYVDTSVIGGCEDKEFRGPSRRLIERCERGEVTLVLSEVTFDELELAPRAVQDALLSVRSDRLEMHAITDEIKELANRYLAKGIFTMKMAADALHIAAATVARADVLVSWNLRHIVNLHRIRKYTEVNRRAGYPPIEVRSPMDLQDED